MRKRNRWDRDDWSLVLSALLITAALLWVSRQGCLGL